MSQINSDALRIILAKRRTALEVVRLLVKKGYDEDEAWEAADRYRAMGYIDHEDYARRFVHDAAKIRKLGPVRIKMELKNRGIEDEIASKAVEDMEFDLCALMAERFGEGGEIDFKTAKKIKNHFLYKGFSPSEVREAMREIYTIKGEVDE